MKPWSGVFGLDGNLRLSLAAPEVVVEEEEEEEGGMSASICLVSAGWVFSSLHPGASQSRLHSPPQSLLSPLADEEPHILISFSSSHWCTGQSFHYFLSATSSWLLTPQSAAAEFSLQRTICSVNAEEIKYGL